MILFDDLTLDELRTRMAGAPRFQCFDSAPELPPDVQMSPVPRHGWLCLDACLQLPRARFREAHFAGLVSVFAGVVIAILSVAALNALFGFRPGGSCALMLLFLLLATYGVNFWQSYVSPDELHEIYSWLDLDQRLFSWVALVHDGKTSPVRSTVPFEELLLLVVSNDSETCSWSIEISSWKAQAPLRGSRAAPHGRLGNFSDEARADHFAILLSRRFRITYFKRIIDGREGDLIRVLYVAQEMTPASKRVAVRAYEKGQWRDSQVRAPKRREVPMSSGFADWCQQVEAAMDTGRGSLAARLPETVGP